jgi:Kef-type K+ transport system membrane component KefB
MSVVLFWLLILVLFGLIARLGQSVGLIPIVSQLLAAAIGLPILMWQWVEPYWQLNASAVLAPHWVGLAYGLSFALLLGHILAEVVDVGLSAQSLKIALPSFLLPFGCGLTCALWLFDMAWLSALSIGLLFAITAIPVLYLYLRNIGYPATGSLRLLQAAIVIDLLCWGIFALAQGSTQWGALLWPLMAALLPVLLRGMRVRSPMAYSLPFFALMVALHLLQFNALVFGMLYMLCLAGLGQPFSLPCPPRLWNLLQTGLAIPIILAFGMLQVDFRAAWQDYSWLHLIALLILPMASKLAGNWLGLCWADRCFAPSLHWRETVLLNIRGLTEIVFLNLLLHLHLIDSLVYFSLVLMSLLATLLPALLGIRSAPCPAQERKSHVVHEP